MIKGIQHAAAGMIARMKQQNTISNNLANTNTTGYKANRFHFSREINSELLKNSYPNEEAFEREKVFYLQTDFVQGAFTNTRNPLDVAISGQGFFAVESDEGVGYTRNGNFTLNVENELVNTRGDLVLGQDGAIRITGADVIIRETGEVLTEGRIVGRLKVVDFGDKAVLKRNGDGYFVPEDETEPVTLDNARILQGKLEKSNVNPVREMVQMIELNRNFEALQKAVHAQDETLRKLTAEYIK